MNCKIWTAIISCSLLTSCFSRKKGTDNTTEDFGFFKTEDAKNACVSTNVSQWELTGSFLHKFLRCASNKSSDGSETLGGLQKLLGSFDEQKMQAVLDFVLTVDPNGTNHEERYPYLLALTTVLDRGINDGNGLNFTTDRLGSLQDFLMTFDANRSREILSAWSRSGHLAEVLNELGIFVRSLEDYTVEVYAREMLSGRTLRPEALAISRRVLKEEALFTSISKSIEAKPSRVLSASEQAALLKPYRESLSESDGSLLAPVVPESKIEVTPLEVLAEEHKAFSAKELTALKDLILSYWKSYQALALEERASLDSRLSEGLDALFQLQAEPVKWLLSLARDGRDLSAADLARVTFAMDQLLLEGNNLSLEAIRAKSGASKLMSQLESLLAEGGSIPSCSIFDQAPLATDRFENLTATLDALSRPSTQCNGRVPLLAAIEHFTGLTLADNFEPETVFSTNLDPRLAQRLTIETFTNLKKESAVEPYRFFNLQLATDRISAEDLQKIEAQLVSNQDWSAEGLARLDETLNALFAGKLEADFIEKLLTFRIETLQTLSYQFRDLAPETSEELDGTIEARSSRVFAGLYSGGPIEELLALKTDISKFSFSEDQADLKAWLTAHPSVFSRILFKAREAESAFRSPSMGTLAGEATSYFSGAGSSLRNYVGFSQTSSALSANITASASHRILQPSQAFRAFSDDEQGRSGWGLWYQQFATGPIVSKDVPSELSKKLEEWFLTSLVPTLSDPSFWPELNAGASFFKERTSPVSSDYYDVEAYSPSEARLLASYYYKQYQKPGPLPFRESDIALGKSSAPKNDLAAFADPISGFFNTSYLVRDDYEGQYTAYARSFPNVFREGTTLSSIRSSVLPDYAGFQAIESSFAFPEQAQQNSPDRLAYDVTSPLALLSTLDLLTFSKPQTRFMPHSVVGFGGKLCRSKTKDPVTPTIWVEGVQACPIDFQGASEEEAYGKFRDYIADTATRTFCPFLASDEFGPSFIWSQRLGVTLDNQTLCSGPTRNASNLLEAYRFPTWHSSRVLSDVFTMGRSAKLKSGLAALPSAIRFHKIKAKGLTPKREALEFLSMAKGQWSTRQAADQRRREFFAGSFWVGTPSLMNSYLNLVSQNVDVYTWRTTLIAYAERDAEGQQKDTLRDILRTFSAQQKESAAAGESGLLFGIKVVDKIFGNEEQRKFLANFLADFNSSEAYDFYSNELPMALVQLFPEDQNPFDWNDKGLRFSKYLGQHAVLRTWQRVSELFTAGEINRFIETSLSATSVLPDVMERNTFVTKALDEALKLGTLYQAETKTHVSENLEELARLWSRLDLGTDIVRDWTSLVTKITLPLAGLDGETKISGQSALESFLGSFITKGPSLLQKMQKASQVQGSALQTEPLFWRNWMNNMFTTVDTQDEGSFAMASFLSEPRFGISLDHGALWLPLLEEGPVQARAVTAIEAMDSVPLDLWRTALTEMTELSGRLTRALGFLKRNLVWNVDPENNAYRIALDKIYELSRDEELRNKQLELLTLWLGGQRSAETADALPDDHGLQEDK